MTNTTTTSPLEHASELAIELTDLLERLPQDGYQFPQDQRAAIESIDRIRCILNASEE